MKGDDLLSHRYLLFSTVVAPSFAIIALYKQSAFPEKEPEAVMKAIFPKGCSPNVMLFHLLLQMFLLQQFQKIWVRKHLTNTFVSQIWTIAIRSYCNWGGGPILALNCCNWPTLNCKCNGKSGWIGGITDTPSSVSQPAFVAGFCVVWGPQLVLSFSLGVSFVLQCVVAPSLPLVPTLQPIFPSIAHVLIWQIHYDDFPFPCKTHPQSYLRETVVQDYNPHFSAPHM